MSSNITLKNLRLLNFATFKQQTINFTDNFNAIIGETGSGKSLILDALNFVMGQRADKKFIRKTAEYSIIEACYAVDNEGIYQFFLDLGFPYNENEIHIKRVLYRNGSSKCFLNHMQCSLKTISDVSKRFIDFVGQFENQKLLSPKYQLRLVDRYGKLDNTVSKFQSNYQKLKNIQQKLIDSISEHQKLNEKKDFYEFQINEIEKLNPSLEREQELIKLKDYMQNHQRRVETKYQLEEIIERSQVNLKQAEQIICHTDFLPDETNNLLENAQSQLEEFSYLISNIDTCTDDLVDLEDIIDELSQYQKLKRKFGGSIEALVHYYNNTKKEIHRISLLEKKIEILRGEIELCRNKCLTIARKLTLKRQNYACELSKKMTKSIHSLNMQNAKLKIEISETDEFNELGNSHIKFLAQINAGEGFHSIKDTASGGELSRILLSMRHILSASDTISIFLFDEIDTGIGGETAKAIGSMLKQIAEDTQVIAITHIPQIAHRADQLVIVDKETIKENKQQRTASLIRHITGEDKTREVESMRSLA